MHASRPLCVSLPLISLLGLSSFGYPYERKKKVAASGFVKRPSAETIPAPAAQMGAASNHSQELRFDVACTFEQHRDLWPAQHPSVLTELCIFTAAPFLGQHAAGLGTPPS